MVFTAHPTVAQQHSLHKPSQTHTSIITWGVCAVVVCAHLFIALLLTRLSPAPEVHTARTVQVSIIQQAAPKATQPTPHITPEPPTKKTTTPKPETPQPKAQRPNPAPVVTAKPTAVAPTKTVAPVTPVTPTPPASKPVQSTPLTPPTAEATPKTPTPAKPPEPTPPPSNEPVNVVIGSSIRYIREPEVEYPEISQELGEKGTVYLRIEVGTNGAVENVSVKKSSGYKRLDQAAMSAIRRARFEPYKENGVAKRATTIAPFEF